jgi:hypothetical protein
MQEKGLTDFVVVHVVCATGLLSDGTGDVFCTLKSVSAEEGGEGEKKQSKLHASAVRVDGVTPAHLLSPPPLAELQAFARASLYASRSRGGAAGIRFLADSALRAAVASGMGPDVHLCCHGRD